MALKLARRFYARSTVEVARDLLGKILLRRTERSCLRGRIVETEAYLGETDPGSHAYRGPTKRTEVMFGEPGHLYVYFTYGMHYCANVVTDVPEEAGAVLLRALEPLDGMALMQQRRGNRPLVELCNGPAKLCEAFGIIREHNGADLMGDEIWIEDDGYPNGKVAVTTRVGLSRGHELPLRYFIEDSAFVSRGKPSMDPPRQNSTSCAE